MQPAAILFDLWETLINDTPERAQPRRTWRSESVQSVLRTHGADIALASIQAALDASTRALTLLHDEGKDLVAGGRAELFSRQLQARSGTGAPLSALSALEDVITSMPLELAPVAAPHAREVTSAIKQRGLATGLICNAGFTTTPHLLPMLEHYELLHHLDVMVFSDELTIAKPDSRVFATALDAIGIEARHCVFVGDNPHTDIAGSQRVGFFAVQIGDKQRDGVTPDARIDSLDQLLPLLDTLA